MKKITILLILLLSVSVVMSQYNAAKEYLDRKGEVYFSFYADSKELINELTTKFSIDNVIKENNTYKVFAYANQTEFDRFISYNIPYEVLEHPGDNNVKSSSDFESIEAWDSYPTLGLYISMMNQFQSQYPNLCKIVNIGMSNQNKPILFAKLTDSVNTRKPKPRVMITSSMHGDELTGYVLSLRLIDTLLRSYNTVPQIAYFLNRVELWINPIANPDGTFVGSDTTVNNAKRYNANNYDLNRNFPDPAAGPYPNGTRQTETSLFMNLADQYVWTLSINFHGGAEVMNIPWDTWSRHHYDNDWFVHISKTYVDTVHAIMPSYMDDYLSSDPGIAGVTNGYAWYRVTGGRQDYMNYWQGSKEVTAEISGIKKPAASTLPSYWNYSFRSFLNYIRESLYGVRGIVTDSVTNQPLKAKLEVNGYDITDSTFIYSDSIAGDYHRMLKTGIYTFKFFKTGYVTKVISNVNAYYDSTVYLDVKLRPINVGIANNEMPLKLMLSQNYPNPFNPNTTIKYSIPESGRVIRLSVFDITGKLVSTLINEKMNKGEYEIDFDAARLSSGVYFYSLFIDDLKTDTKRMVLIK